jgi:hypothetical protein
MTKAQCLQCGFLHLDDAGDNYVACVGADCDNDEVKCKDFQNSILKEFECEHYEQSPLFE